jgi:hypothetical protein
MYIIFCQFWHKNIFVCMDSLGMQIWFRQIPHTIEVLNGLMTYYTILESSGVKFEPHPNRYPSDYLEYLLKNIEVSSTINISQWKLCLHFKFSTTVKHNQYSENCVFEHCKFSATVSKFTSSGHISVCSTP